MLSHFQHSSVMSKIMKALVKVMARKRLKDTENFCLQMSSEM
jgi:hypothetical protein